MASLMMAVVEETPCRTKNARSFSKLRANHLWAA
jgi:hypothetical protein